MKKIITLAILLSFIGINMPAQALFSSGVSETKQMKKEAKAKQKAQEKSDKELYKKVKSQKDLPYKKYRVANKYDYINMPWWESFNDTYLTGYINKAMEYNFDLKIATLTVEEYFQGVKLQMANELPQAEIGLGAGAARLPKAVERYRYDRSVSGIGFPVIASYEADIFLKNHDKTTSAKKAFQASVSQERATYIAIVSAVGTVYYNIVRLDKMISLQEDIVGLRKEIYELMKLSNACGVVSTSDMIKAEKSYIAGQSDLVDLKRQRIELLNQFAVLIGESPANIDTLERISYNDINYIPNVPNEISSDVIVNRPDYLKAEAMLKKAGIDVRVAKKEFLPSVDILGLALFGAKHLGSLFTTNNAIGAIGGNISLPLFTGGARIANLKLNKIRMEKALRDYQKTNLTAIQEVNDALYGAKLDNQKLSQNKEHLALETKDFSLTRQKYDQGTISRLNVCQMQENLLVIEKLVASNTLDCMIDEITLYKAVGADGLGK